MNSSQTFVQKLYAGIAAILLLTVVLCVLAASNLSTVVTDYDRLMETHSEALLQAQQMETLLGQKFTAFQSFLLTGSARYRQGTVQDHMAIQAIEQHLRQKELTPDAQSKLAQIASDQAGLWSRVQAGLQRRAEPNASLREMAAYYEQEIAPRAHALDADFEAFAKYERDQRNEAKRTTFAHATNAIWITASLAALAVILGGAIAWVLTRGLTRQVGGAIAHLQNSSSELQAASKQQATGSGEQAAAMSEVATTMKELLATSRQITENAQRVAGIAEETAAAAQAGDRA
ncbi:MAG TPA: hypothetical protein V6D47_15195, partial [Oscillatoriaceae cyanobacterium]